MKMEIEQSTRMKDGKNKNSRQSGSEMLEGVDLPGRSSNQCNWSTRDFLISRTRRGENASHADVAMLGIVSGTAAHWKASRNALSSRCTLPHPHPRPARYSHRRDPKDLSMRDGANLKNRGVIHRERRHRLRR